MASSKATTRIIARLRGSAPQRMEPGTTPRITKLMALALKFDRLDREGLVEDYADLARLGHVFRARMTQIMGLLNLAPDIQEEIVFLPKTVRGRDPISAREVLKLGATSDDRAARASLHELRRASGMSIHLRAAALRRRSRPR